MSDETTAALQALIKQVETLTTTVTDQQKRMDGLYEHNSRLLDQIKDGKRESTPVKKSIVDIVQEERREQQMRDAGLERAADGNWYPKGIRPAHSITRAEARDPVKYREAKAAAEKAGANLHIFDPSTSGDAQNRGRPNTAATRTSVVKDEDACRVYIRRDVMGSSDFRAQYRKLREDGFTPVSWDQPDDLPQHMQTKLRLMENAANASASDT
ncbi:hypothetical protein [Ruegeria arenilitoris]|uniref:hypothetical protein n=1 Tax=Ruegeria arenilitoris TaxID=1173585 RepID=UPI00147ED46A|nr:hypothetical protein [Ruegeria arenilitoris]